MTGGKIEDADGAPPATASATAEAAPTAEQVAAHAPAPSSEINRTDWTLLLFIVAIGGGSFSMIRLAVETIPPVWVGAGRLWVGALVLYALMRAAGRRFPPFFAVKDGRRTIDPRWRAMMGVGLVGNTIPFVLFPWAQQHVPSGLAGIYMAFMPLATLVLAQIFARERLTGRKIFGAALGFVGILILMGPEILAGVTQASTLAQLALLFAAMLYAVSAIIARVAPEMPARSFSAGVILSASIAMSPLALFTPAHFDQWSATSAAAILGLGLLPTGINQIAIITLIRSAGAGFMSLSNFLVPLWAVGLGALIFHERLPANAFAALAVILAGLAISHARGFGRDLKRDAAAQVGDAAPGERDAVPGDGAAKVGAPPGGLERG